jgi:26S proteasome regulatory subunit N12
MASHDAAKALFETLKKSFEAKPCDLAKCDEQLAQLKLLVFSSLSTRGALTSSDGTGAVPQRELAREMLELACYLSIKREEMSAFERHVAQLKMYYNDNQKGMKPSDKKYQILGLYLLHLLSQDRIGEFHTELELIPVDDHKDSYIQHPVNLERYIMEGNYAKILEAKKDKNMSQDYYSHFLAQLEDTVRTKIGASLERAYESLPANEAAKMLSLPDVSKLQEFVMQENERKQQNQDDHMGDMTPSLSRRNLQVSICKWEVKDGRIHFTRDAEKRPEIWEDLMVNTIGYATDLERIV